MTETLKQNNSEEEKPVSKDTLSDVRYICKSSYLITEALQNGYDVAQLPNGDIIVTEIKTVNVQYSWDPEKNKMVRVNCNIAPQEES
jgi:hypothetical protein